MKEKIKTNINSIITLFIILSPFIDLLTGLALHYNKSLMTVGMIVRTFFLILIMGISLLVYKRKKLLYFYAILLIYFILYILGIYLYKDGVGLFYEIQGLIKTFYFPILLISMYFISKEITISKYTLSTILVSYLLLILIPYSVNLGFKSYEITKAGNLGFFNSANEISGIISLLTPIIFITFASKKNILRKIIFGIMYLFVILMIGTKTPLITLCITIGFSMVYLFTNLIRNKKYKLFGISIITFIVILASMLMYLPHTNFYKNIETHMDYLKLNSMVEVFDNPRVFDHFIFSERLKFFSKRQKYYDGADNYQKLFGIGYLKNGKREKLVEMDYFDIYFSHGIVGFILFFSIMMAVFRRVLRRKKEFSYESYMISLSVFLILLLSLFTGHIITAPSVSLLSIIIIFSLLKKDKKTLLFTSFNLKVGGIEKALVNLVNKIDKNKYQVTIVLEKLEGELISKVDPKVVLKEVQVSDSKNIFIRKIVNGFRKYWFKLLYYDTYDFSCCYATYSYSCSKLALIASSNSSFYVHSDYGNVYNNEKDFRKFFDTRNVEKYKYLVFVSNESRDSFLKYYEKLSSKTYVFNNFVDVKDIKEKSMEEIDLVKSKDKKLFVFVGRLDDSSKKLKRAINLVKEINASLWIVGDGKDRGMYEEYVKELDVNKDILFVGNKTNPYPYMSCADYIILTSDYEGFPVIYVEALVLEKSVITTINTSDDYLNMKDYAYVVSKEEDIMSKEVKKILESKTKRKKINIGEIQNLRIKRMEDLFDGVI